MSDLRLRVLDDRPVDPKGRYVLYWMIAARRTRFNFALQHALQWAKRLGRPLLIFEPLRAGYAWAADRHHAFVIQGMADHAARLSRLGVRYLPYLEPKPGAARGLLRALAESAAVVVTDDSPAFHYPRMLRAAAAQVECRLEAIDGNGLLPLRAPDRDFTRAHSFRAYLQRELPAHLERLPVVDPLAKYDLGAATIPRTVLQRWPGVSAAALREPARLVAALPLDREPDIVEGVSGGEVAGARRLEAFVADRLANYGSARNHPDDEDSGSGLSPHLHFGHVGAHQVFHAICRREGWSPASLGPPQGGSRGGFWGMSEAAEAFVDQFVTWREMGYVMNLRDPDFHRFESLPPWARKTMAEHAKDPRPSLYTTAQLENAETYDPLWNAAQRQLRVEGRIHNYLRMLWGKKIYEWSASGEEAFTRLVELNDRWALDGRDPNTLSSIGWVLGRFDRAWGPERPIFGKLRYMSSDSARRKLRLTQYLQRWSDQTSMF
ncbi:MAG: deoxyribodipyrimidine photolyase [Myxococcota bacterium]